MNLKSFKYLLKMRQGSYLKGLVSSKGAMIKQSRANPDKENSVSHGKTVMPESSLRQQMMEPNLHERVGTRQVFEYGSSRSKADRTDREQQDTQLPSSKAKGGTHSFSIQEPQILSYGSLHA